MAPAVPSTTASSVVPTSEPMTMLQPDESTQSTPQKKNVSVSGTTAVRPKKSRGRSPTVAPMALMGQSDVGVFLQPKSKPAEQEESISKPQPQSADSVDSEADVFMVDPTGNLLTGEKAKKRLKELGFARTESVKSQKTSTMDTTSGSYTWQAPAEMMEEAVKQVRKEMVVQENVRKSSTPKAREVRQSVIKEWTEEQLLMILVELGF